MYPRFSEAEMTRRERAMRQLMQAHDVSALIVYGNAAARADVQYLSGFAPRWDTYYCLAEAPIQPPTLFVQLFNHVPNARELATVADVRWGGVDSVSSVLDWLAERSLATAAVGFVGPLPYQAYGRLIAGRAQVVDLSAAFRQHRLVKSAEEIAWVRRGAELSDLGLRALIDGARPGMKEYELGALVECTYARAGGQHGICYLATTSMAAGGRCLPAQTWSERVLDSGDAILIELSAGYWGAQGQILRTLTLGEPTPLYQRLHSLAEETYAAMVHAIRPGVAARDLLPIAARIEAAGFTICDDLVHGYGGGYLPPVLRTPSTQHAPPPELVFEPGMLLVVQPNVVTRDGRHGVQTGQLGVVTEHGFESLHGMPVELLRLA
jgi:Xaa-Pro aminopeptidase